MQVSRKKYRKVLSHYPCDWFVGHYSFNLPLALKPIAPVPDAYAIRVVNTLLLC